MRIHTTVGGGLGATARCMLRGGSRPTTSCRFLAMVAVRLSVRHSRRSWRKGAPILLGLLHYVLIRVVNHRDEHIHPKHLRRRGHKPRRTSANPIFLTWQSSAPDRPCKKLGITNLGHMCLSALADASSAVERLKSCRFKAFGSFRTWRTPGTYEGDTPTGHSGTKGYWGTTGSKA
jgi:hypothetical protein